MGNDRLVLKKKGNYPRGERKEVRVSIGDQDVYRRLAGESNTHLRVMERELDVTITRGHGELMVVGQDVGVDLAADLIMQLDEILTRGEQLFPGDIERALRMLRGDRRIKLRDLFRDQIRISGRTSSIVPKTFHQKKYLEVIAEEDVVFGVGPAGTGKTYLAMAMAVSALLKKEVRRVVLCRPAVEAGERLGFLPGDMAEKVNPYLRPLYDALHDLVDFEKAQELMERGTIEVAPLAFMRGRTLNDAFVILDEAQNTTPQQMKMFLTRLGMSSKCVITGDPSQVDLPRGVLSGLRDAMETLAGVDGISVVQFDHEDVIRHPLVARIVSAYDRKENVDASDTQGTILMTRNS